MVLRLTPEAHTPLERLRTIGRLVNGSVMHHPPRSPESSLITGNEDYCAPENLEEEEEESESESERERDHQ